ncbi:putative NADH dehydrogenase 1 alpha subcomplex subunit 5 [Podospora aff. communis PSN243]|uniref:NADH dehydrogenase 1 alpha subcomplex subunit 5 n=1 Tax=Podospora aff. communis PSN243 TaxID=3040156 RepID=A0AAV9GST7_9PEZI|nr:putative NADH dehydrogenase 1 alpha subcomplex subunit 5 [Podospora aff. communis PSN243]
MARTRVGHGFARDPIGDRLGALTLEHLWHLDIWPPSHPNHPSLNRQFTHHQPTMRRTFRLLAAVKPARYIESGRPTGLAGLYSHPSPRSTLLFLYSSTLDKLKAVPEHSVYRQSVEAVTKHRMQIVEQAVPPGYEEWAVTARKLLADELEASKSREALASELKKAEEELAAAKEKNLDADEANRLSRIANIRELLELLPTPPADSNIILSATHGEDTAVRVERGGQAFFIRHLPKVEDMREKEWDGYYDREGQGLRTLKETKMIREELEYALKAALEGKKPEPKLQPRLQPEPQPTAEQIHEIEEKIGAGLIEEVIQVAEGELKLVDSMVEAKVWESLEETPAPGQWTYFERNSA